MSNNPNPDPWGNQNRPLGQNFNRQHPPVLPPPATLETGMYYFHRQIIPYMMVW